MKKKIVAYMLVLAFSMGLCSCNSEVVLEKNQYYIYYVDKDFEEMSSEIYQSNVSSEKTLSVVNDLLAQLKRSPDSVNELSPIAEEMPMVDVKLNDKKVTLNFDANYVSLKGIEEVLRRGAIVKTLTQADGVDAVEFTVEGQPLMIQNTAVGFMKGDDFIDDIGGTSVVKTTTISMYFADASGKKLVEVPSKVTYDSTIPMGQLMVEQLIRGPQNVENLKYTGLKSTISSDVVLNSLTIRDNVCYVDFSSQFEEALSDVSLEVTVYSVVNLLAELPNVNKVQITIEGEQVTFSFDDGRIQPYERNLDLVVPST